MVLLGPAAGLVTTFAGPLAGYARHLGRPRPRRAGRPRSAAEQVTGEPAGLGQSDEVAAGQ